MRRIVGLLAFIGLASVGAVVTAPLAQAADVTFTPSPATVKAGGTVTFTIAGCFENQESDITTPLKDPVVFTTDVTGAATVPFVVPADTPPGTYTATLHCLDSVNPSAVADFTVSAESISLVKTVGTTPGVCATTSTLSVTAGTTVYYCYTVTNNTTQKLGIHNLTDDKLGTILTGAPYDLAPGASANTVALGKTVSATATATVTNTATWIAYTDPGVPFSATASATVTVTAVPAAAAAVTPSFTG